MLLVPLRLGPRSSGFWKRHELPDRFGEKIEVRNQPFRNSESSSMKRSKSLWAGLCVIFAFLAAPEAAALPEAFQIDKTTPLDFKMDRIQILKIEEAGHTLLPQEALEILEKSGGIVTKQPWRRKNKFYWQYLSLKNTKSEDFVLRLYWQGFDRPDIYLHREGGGIATLKFKSLYSYNHLAGGDAERDGAAAVESRYMTTNVPPHETIGILVRVKDNENLGTALGLGDHTKLLEWDRFFLYFDGFFAGGVFFMAIYALMVALKSSNLKDFLYAGILLFLSALVSIKSGQPIDGSALFEFWIGDDLEHIWFADYVGSWATCLSFYLYFLFCYVILESENFNSTGKWILIGRSLVKASFFGGLIFLCLNVLATYSISMQPDVWGGANGISSNSQEQIFFWTASIPDFITFLLCLALILEAIRVYRLNVSGSGAILCTLVFVSASQFNLLDFLPLKAEFRMPLTMCVVGLLMAYSTISKNKQTQDALTDAMKTRQTFIEDQNRLLEERVVQRTSELQAQTEKTEKLMLNILPKSIADRLKVGEEKISDSHTDATILFSDLVGFTKMSAGKSAEELVFLLNDLFTRFDQRALALGLEKIKTIGDAYMVAGGIPNHVDDHAIQVVKMALGMYEDLDAFNAEHSMDLGMRVGINSGPVVAGVIGHSKFSYDLWGNTVNTASRMESTSVPGKIQVSPSTHAQIREHFKIQERELIECKGLGQIMTYFVTAPV
jgi:class 3 adenylate cyclase